jgi:hypothetical protein
MNHRRIAGCVVVAVLVGGLLGAPTAIASSPAPVVPAPADPVIGHLAYVTKHQQVKLATVRQSGATSSMTTIGPVTHASASQSIQISGLTASGDGNWLAWDEQRLDHHGTGLVDTHLVMRDVVDATTTDLKTAQAPVGFAGDMLVTTSGDVTKRLDLHPHAHLVKLPLHQFPLGTYALGVLDTLNLQAPAGPRRTDRLRLSTLSGDHTALHDYVLGRAQYDDPDAAWSSADGKQLVIERGNHQDFGGLGPSSLADEYALAGAHHRTRLGHYGTARAAWRIASVTYSGAADQVWVVWERATKTGASGLVARYSGGAWHRVAAHAIAAAGNAAGDVVVQLGKYVPVGHDATDFATVPTGSAFVVHHGDAAVLDLEGSAFAWVS